MKNLAAAPRSKTQRSGRRAEARAAAYVAAGLIAANAVVGAAIGFAVQDDLFGHRAAAPARLASLDPAPPPPASSSPADILRNATGLASPKEAMAAGAMIFLLSGFASALVMRIGGDGRADKRERGEPKPAPSAAASRAASAREHEPRQP